MVDGRQTLGAELIRILCGGGLLPPCQAFGWMSVSRPSVACMADTDQAHGTEQPGQLPPCQAFGWMSIYPIGGQHG